MLLRYRSFLSAALAAVCVLLSTSTSLRAEDDDGDEARVVIALTAAEKAQTQALNSQPVQTVPLSAHNIVPSEYNGDVRYLPPALVPRYLHSWNEFEEPLFLKTPPAAGSTPTKPSLPPERSAPMPSPSKNFAGLSFGTALSGGTAGAGWPPDTNGDVGPVYYIQAVNDAWGIFDKSTGARVAGFTEDQLWATATTGTPCDSNNNGDPVAIHDGLADRWVLTDFAFTVDASNNPVAPFYQCFAVSKTSDPVTGGWYLYAVQMDTGATGAPPAHTFADYPKFGFWTDCLYMGANGFDNDSGNYAGSVFAAFDRTALFSGAALTGTNSSLGFISSDTSFGLFPANLQGTSAGSQPPAGTAEYFVAESGTDFAFDVRKFQKGATACGAGSSLSGVTSVSQTAYGVPYDTAATTPNIVSQPSVARKLDSLGDELMQRVVYRKIGSAESLWVIHTTCGTGQSANQTCVSATTPTQPQWAQIDVSAGIIHTTPVQQQIYNVGDGLYRWMGSIAVDGQGNMAIGYDTSGTTAPHYPSIAYSGRLATDALNQLPQTEVQLAAGLGSQNTCGTGCGGLSRWGDYSAMVIDPVDDCTFWYTNMYFSAAAHTTGAKWDTRIGSFKFPGCEAVVTTYTVTASVSGGNGTITPASQPVNAGATATFTVTSNSGFHVATVTGDTCTVSNTSGTTWTSSAINQNCAVTATFAVNVYTVTASVSGGNGTITPASQPVNSGAAANFTVTPNVGYHVFSVTGSTCTPTQGIGTAWSATNITAACAVTATFEADSFTVTSSVSSGNGTVTPSTQPVLAGATAAFTIAPAPGSYVQLVQGDTCTVTNTSGTLWTSSAIHADCAVSVTFAPNPLVFTQQPGNLPSGSVLGTIQVTEEDGSNNPVDDNATVTFTIAICSGTLDLGSVQMVHGVATLTSTQVFYTVAPSLHIGASAGSLSGNSQTFAVTANTDLPFADGFESCRP